MRDLIKSTFVVSFCTLLSRIFGFLRDMVIASKLGTGIYNDAFVAAFKLANMFRNIFSEGALSAAFIPEFSKVLKEKGKKDALIFASQIHSLLIISLFIFCVLIIIFMPEVIWYTTPGFRDDMHIYNLTVLFGRITFPYLLFISIASFYGGVLNAFNKFFAFSFAPIILNISCIIGLSLFDNLDTSSHTLSIATLVGGVLELLWMLFFLIKYNCGVSIIKIKMTPEVIRTLKKMVPIIISSGVMHINSWVSMVILSFFTGGLSYMYYADRIVHLPLALIGTAAGTVLLPKLAQRNDKNTSNIENHSIKFVLFLAIPATFALMLMSYDIIEILFQRDEFSSNSTRETALMLNLLVLGLPAYVLIKIFQVKFYAQLDTITPVVISIFCIIINVVISILLMGKLKYLGVAIANSIAGWVNIILLVYISGNKFGFSFKNNILKEVAKMVVAATMMVIFIYYMQSQLWAFNKHLIFIVEVIFGAAIYFFMCYLLKIEIYGVFKNILKKNK